ncbi:MAG: DUF2996 domain-containing protein [Oculatellaceae cyanobacterium Prado106]|jgi:hypothetical protein|nr:DUF2996 domain-containing protein [Oculatellaceae cyanobacterium Prado106]
MADEPLQDASPAPKTAEAQQITTPEEAQQAEANKAAIASENLSVARATDDVIAETLKSTTTAETTDMPTSSSPDPGTLNRKKAEIADQSPDQTEQGVRRSPKKAEGATAVAERPAKAKAEKKEKAPAIEDKPFADFIQQDYLPALQTALTQQGIQNLELTFAKQPIPLAGFNQMDECWQVIGRWGGRQFNIYFMGDNLDSPKGFSCAEAGTHPSIVEPFLIDERKITLGLLVFGVYQRLFAQKWLAKN